MKVRILTPTEQRELEALKRSLYVADATIEIREENREMWLNVLEMVLQTQEAMKAAWRRSPNPQIDLIQVVKQEIECFNLAVEISPVLAATQYLGERAKLNDIPTV